MVKNKTFLKPKELVKVLKQQGVIEVHSAIIDTNLGCITIGSTRNLAYLREEITLYLKLHKMKQIEKINTGLQDIENKKVVKDISYIS